MLIAVKRKNPQPHNILYTEYFPPAQTINGERIEIVYIEKKLYKKSGKYRHKLIYTFR